MSDNAWLRQSRHRVHFWTRISCMEGEYSQEWAELRRLRQRVLTIALTGAGVFVLVPLVTRYASHSAAKVIGFALFAAWVVMLFRFFFVSGEVCLLVMPQMRQAFPLRRTLVRQMEQSLRSALRPLWLAKVGGLRPRPKAQA